MECLELLSYPYNKKPTQHFLGWYHVSYIKPDIFIGMSQLDVSMSSKVLCCVLEHYRGLRRALECFRVFRNALDPFEMFILHCSECVHLG